jgi:hypothetical protein
MRRLPWLLFGLWLALTPVTVVLAMGDRDKFGAFTPLLAGFAIVGALVASRQPGNALGWTLLVIVIVFELTVANEAYVDTSAHPAEFSMWLDNWLADVWIGLVGVALPLLFPDGRLPGRRWRWVAAFGAAAFALGALAKAFGAQALDIDIAGEGPNPYALPGALGDGLAALIGPAQIGYAMAVLGAMAAVVARMRRAEGLERQQLKWFAYVGTLMLAALLLAAIAAADSSLPVLVGDIGWMTFLLLLMVALPVALGFAILKHRLYDIDVVINRTLVYGALTVALGATYLALVLLVGLTVGRSNAAIAVSTLAVAALFRPLRTRIQAAVDRRFYRRRYDAARTLEAFGGRLREELDLDALRGEIASVVGETVQPAHVSVWLRGER